MAKTGLVQDERFQHHLTGPDHPERPQRLVAICESLSQNGFSNRCIPVEATPVGMDFVTKIHSTAYVDRLIAACQNNRPYIDVPDSAICPESYEIARLAAGGVMNAVERVMDGQLNNAFCAIRPPGHHAEHDRSMGFCLFNNMAVAANHLLEHHNLQRVLILDWDVHHGNGTQHTFEADPRVLFISIHGHPKFVYPGTGYEHEKGVGPGMGLTINCPMLPPSSDEAYHRVFDETILPATGNYQPQFVLLSAGFDAHRLDPLAPLELPTESFEWMTDTMLTVAKEHSQGRLVSILEGGYHLDALADCVALHVSGLIEA